MKAGLKILAMLALVAGGMGLADHAALANCQDGLTAIYRVIQCGSATATGAAPNWFAPAPSGSGAVSAAWWQAGFGNNNDNTSGGAPAGNGFLPLPLPGRFIGNDSGLNTGDPAKLDLVDGAFVGGPPGSLCFSSGASWARSGNDGCADNIRTGGTALGNPSKDDNHLNPYYYSHPSLAGAGLGSYTQAYQLDAPMGVLLTESNGKSFALAFFASEPRPVGQPSADPSARAGDASPGNFDMQHISNGDPNPATPGRNNVVPWQPIPNPNVSAAFTNPADTTSDRILTMSWNAVRLVHDNSTRPTSDTTLPTPGVGVNDQGTLVRYAVETAPILDASGACGSFTPFPGASTTGTSLVVQPVPRDTCVRLRSIFGKIPNTSTVNSGNAAGGRLGDLGYSVTHAPILIGGQLISNKLTLDSVKREKGNLIVSFHTASELSNPRFEVRGVGANGRDLGVLGSTDCSACTSGLGSSYTVEASGKGGVKSVFVVSSTGERSNTLEVR